MFINLIPFEAVMQFASLDIRKIILLFEIAGAPNGEIKALLTHPINTLLRHLKRPMEPCYETDNDY